MSKYFGKCFSPSTPAPESSFWLRCPSFLLSKFASELKLIQSVVRVRILGICITSSVLGLRVASSKYQGPICRVLGVRVPCPRVPVPRSWVSGSQSPRVLGLRVLGSGSQVSGSWSRVAGPDFRLCLTNLL